ncbi:MAG: xanthine dehydrogenase family protein molybdopterin-binding subunit [Candidatus Caldarchaeum sp.]
MLVGKPLKRINDRKFLQGLATYVSDLKLPGMVYMHVVRSRYAHAWIKEVDVSKAVKHGVLAAYTHRDFEPIEIDAEEATENAYPVHQKILADRKARYVGEPVAVVVSESYARGVDAAEEVEVVYEPLKAVMTPEEALSPGAPLIHDHLSSNIYFRMSRQVGDVDEAFRKADEVVSASFKIQRLAPASMETRGVVASYNPSTDFYTLYVSSQNPHKVREFIAYKLGVGQNSVRVIAPDVGGGFGSKLNIYPEDLLASILSKKLRRPVAWFETRTENFTATSHGRSMQGRIEIAASRDGRILGLKAETTADMGAYSYIYSRNMSSSVLRMMTGCYKIRNVLVKALGVYTNKTPVAPYRGAGRPEASYFIERAVDRLASKLGLDPAEVRKTNFIKPEDFPYNNGVGSTYDTGDYEKALDKLLNISNYGELRKQQRLMRSTGRYLGIGISTYVEVCNFLQQPAYVRVEPDGSVHVYSGTSPHGQGDETAFAQIVSDTLGVPVERITVVHSDTALGPPGSGTAGSWTLPSGGNAVLKACMRVREKMTRIAAHMLECRSEDLIFEGGAFMVKDDPSRKVYVKDVAEAAYDPDSLPENMEPGLEALEHYVPELTYPFGAHLAIVEVDPETGRVLLRRVVMVNDCGEVVNPLLVEGQVVGGAAQAIGQALYESLEFGEDGSPLVSSFADYLMPTSVEIPEIVAERTVTPARNPLKAKGVGEASTIGLTQAIVNAVEDAIGKPVDETPLTPFRVWSVLNARSR